MSKPRKALALCLLGVGVTILGVSHKPSSSTADARSVPQPGVPKVLSAPAVVEPASKLIALRSQVQGRLERVGVDGGDPVRKGQVLAELENGVERAQLDLRQAELARARAVLTRLEAGTRREHVVRARSEVERAEAALKLARVELERAKTLHRRGVRPASAVDTAEAEFRIAEARRDGARATHEELVNGARPETIAEARAEVSRASAALELARTALERTRIRSPIDGVCVYRHHEPGEVVGRVSEAVPVLIIASSGPLRLRADVDASDLARVRVGQRVVATTPSYPGRTFEGRVVKLERMVGRKNIRTDRPREKIDTKVLEVLIELEVEGDELPLGLEMTVTVLQTDGHS